MDLEQLTQKVFDLQREVGQVVVTNNKLDIMLDRLTVLSQDISKLLAVQSARLEQQERVGNTLTGIIEKRKEEVDKELANIELKFDKIHEKMDKQYEYLKSRFSTIEKWIWIVTGGGIVVGYLLSFALKFI